ncbi:MAG: sulfotransferase domain-containing protein, partial [Phycisphaerales bacterium JB038]
HAAGIGAADGADGSALHCAAVFRHDDRTERELSELAARHRRPGGVRALFRGKPLRNIQHALAARRYDYPHRNLFVAGLPKSGTTWLERMLVSVPGYRKWIPGYIPQTGHDLLPGTLDRPPVGYTVTRVHTQPRRRNLDLLHALGRPYVILYRDPRDIVVSSYYYARNDAEVQYHEKALAVDLDGWIDLFIDERLEEYLAWCIGWLDGRDAARGAVFRYEELLRDTAGQLAAILQHFEIDLPSEAIRAIAERHSFQQATGRQAGQADNTAFNRKGVAGDWLNHFTDSQRERFRACAGERLERIGYTWDD